MVKINSGEFNIYTNEIIHPEIFLELYNKEEILCKFETKVLTKTHYPMATFLAENRHKTPVKEGDLIILRAIKNNKKFEFVTKIGKWGKFSVWKEAVEKLDIQNHENIKFEVIKESNKENSKNDRIDLANINENIIFRKNNVITIFNIGGTPITLPRFIEITPELIELCFLIHGDGSYKTKFNFVNKNPELIQFVIEKFEKIFRIPKNLWRARLLFNNESNSLKAKENWKTKLLLEDEQFYPSISNCVLNTSDQGNLRICIDKVIVASIFRYVFSQLQELSGEKAIYAVNGLLYAEGGARNEKEGGLHKITLSFSQQEKEMFERMLKNAGILQLTRVEQNIRFCISDWSNLYEFFRIFISNDIIPFNIHSERCNKALSGFLKHRFTQTIEKYLKIINEKDKFTIKELQEITGYRYNSVFNTLKKQKYSKFVRFEGRGVNRNPFKISITDEGRNFLELIKNIREEYTERNELKTN